MDKRGLERQLREALPALEAHNIDPEYLEDTIAALIKLVLKVDDEQKANEMAQALSKGGGHGFG